MSGDNLDSTTNKGSNLQRQWAHIALPKKGNVTGWELPFSNSTDSLLGARLKSWSNPDSKVVIDKSERKKIIRERDDGYDSPKPTVGTLAFTKIEKLRFPMSLPLSKSKILVTFEDNKYSIKPKKKMSDESFLEIRQLFSGLDTYIETYRNEMHAKDDDELLELDEDQYRIFITVMNAIHLFSRPFFQQSNPLSLPDPDKSSRSELLMGTIDADFLSMLIALEGMNIIVIYIHFYNFLERFQKSAQELMQSANEIFDNPSDGQLSDLQNIIDNNQCILDILEGIHSLPATGADPYQDLKNKIGPAAALNLSGYLEKYHDLAISPVGKLLIRNAGSTKQFFSSVNWRPDGLDRGSPGFKTLDLMTRFGVSDPASNFVVSSKTTKFGLCTNVCVSTL